MFKKVLIANRGAIACRIIRTLRALGVESVAVFTEADRASRHVTEADEAILIGEGPAQDSYLQGGRLVRIAQEVGAEAIHPGYGFLSENADFAEQCEAAGIVFIGPRPSHLREFGLKHTARAIAREAGVPMLPGTDLLPDVTAALAAAADIDYPVMLKSTAGGGGIGMRMCNTADELGEAFESVQRLSRKSFADGGLYLERFVAAARHVEVQIFGDGKGGVISLGERDCSLQRRNQKVVEETPAPCLPESTRRELAAHAVALGLRVNYRSAGTVEYVYDAARDEFYFLEVNTRLQVEHGVTESVTGVDLVAWMVTLAAGELPPLETLVPEFSGHAVQVRVYAEDPARDFQPSPGELSCVQWPAGARVDSWVEAGVEVPPWYDPMLAKIIVHGTTRAEAIEKLQAALAATRLDGIETNLEYLQQVLALPEFMAGSHSTSSLKTFDYRAGTIEVLAPGTETTVQDFPGRLGYWAVGIPPSGPMDDYSFRLGNRLLSNPPEAACLEINLGGPRLRFNRDAVVCLTGAQMPATLDGQPVPWWAPVAVPAGSVLAIGQLREGGARAYLTLQGGLDVPAYLGSAATFTLGRFGGHGGRALRTGDVLRLKSDHGIPPSFDPAHEWQTPMAERLTLRVIYGPHGAPDFFTPEDIATFFATDWEVHYNSSRTGVRLIGPKPQWARADGGEAGLHPSNLHDNAYAIGAVDFTGDMPVILGPDGPSLGGFVCPVTVIAADRWKLGQLRPGDRLRFVPIAAEEAVRLEADRAEAINTLRPCSVMPVVAPLPATPVITRETNAEHPTGVTYRPAGDRYLLVEYGEQVLDVNLRFRVQALFQTLQQRGLPGILDLTPGIRSLQAHYDPHLISREALLHELHALEADLDATASLVVPSRVVHLPLSWDDPSTRLAIEKYTQSVRPDAPWCPSNIEFIRRINGLSSLEEVKDIVFSASYLVLGLGDVYLGAPVATPLDPRHRLVTTKYNPARTWTPENAVGIGGSYLCVYGMEGPGGYQFVGRTLQMWNRHRSTPEFTQPWLLRFFDQIRFYPVSAEELIQIRRDFPLGRYRLRIEEETFDLAAYNDFLTREAASIATFKSRQQAAFEAERARWQAAGLAQVAETLDAPIEAAPEAVPLEDGEVAVESHVHGNVWQIRVAPGDQVKAGDTLAVLEAMKMEIAVIAEQAGRVSRLCVEPGTQVLPGRALLVLAAD
ncbi:MAG: urea carboxylase [Gammaproteobacteria bacterium]|nr:urea carboxylase [Gammaproteobacteria bacterium]